MPPPTGFDTKEQGEQLLEQATMLDPAFHPAAQEALRRSIAYEARMLSAVWGVERGAVRKQVILLHGRDQQQSKKRQGLKFDTTASCRCSV